MRIAELAGARVAIWGYGREGRAALAALRSRLPALPLTVFASAEEAKAITAPGLDGVVAIAAAPDAAALGAFDVVVKSPGISAYSVALLEAEHNGTRFTSGTALWFAEHRDTSVIAVTGTKGKSTVSALIAHLLRALGRRTALAGNIGLPLLELLDPENPPDIWVIELSSFQTRAAANVAVGVVLNVFEEHLDWHGSRERYVADKLALASVSRTLVANARQAELVALTDRHPHRILFGDAAGWHVEGDAILRGARRALALDALPLAGAHNALNVAAALAAIEAIGADPFAALASLATFRPLPHRLTRLGERDGHVFIDDSIATTPQATLEALASLAAPVTVLVGGFERGLDWSHFADEVARRPPHAIVTMGANGARIARTLAGRGGAYALESAATLADALARAIAITPRPGSILLSPGAASFDGFRDYAERGRAFAALAGFDPATIGAIEGLGIA